MCIFLNKWKSFEPTKEYLLVVNGLTSVTKLYQFIQQFQYTGEKGDIWQTPEEFLKNEHLDCEDFARFAVDVLVRVIKIDGARFVIHSGYNKARWGNKMMCHAITVFPYSGKLALFSVNKFKTGYKDYIETGHYTFPDGLKYMECRDWTGKILNRKWKIFGNF